MQKRNPISFSEFKRKLIKLSKGIANGPTGIVTVWARITPEIAAIIWERFKNECNRKAMQMVRDKYSTDMKLGLWKHTHQGIAFNVNGTMIDGHHTIWSIMDSRITLDLIVTFDLPVDAIEAIDTGKSRNTAHILQLSGHQEADKKATAIMNAMILGLGGHSYSNVNLNSSNAMKIDFYEKNKEVILFARNLSELYLRRAAVAAMISKAAYHEDRELLARFPLAMAGKIPFKEMRQGDEAPSLLDKMMTKEKLGNSYTDIKRICGLTLNALVHYCKGNFLKRLVPAIVDPYPLPDDKRCLLETMDQE